jgi:hypothetical protein
VPCIDRGLGCRRLAGLALVALVWPAVLPARAAETQVASLPGPPASSHASGRASTSARVVSLPPPARVLGWAAYRLQAALRMVAAHPDTSYMGEPPEPLLGIPVLEVQLNADGSVRHIKVLREPVEAKECTQLAIDVVLRAAPYGDVTRLPKPWRFVETFLFDDEHRFKPRTLDQ